MFQRTFPWRGSLAFGFAGLLAMSCGASDESDDTVSVGGTGGAPTGSGVTASSWSTTAGTTSTGPADPCEEYGGYHCNDGADHCYDPYAAMEGPSGVAAMGLDRCTTSEIAAFYDGCFAPSSDAASCFAFQDAHPDCYGCLVPVDENGNADGALPASLMAGGTPLPNVWACHALLAGLPSCAERLGDWQACAFSTCEACPDIVLSTCFEKATSPGGVCFDNLILPVECEALLSEPSPPACANGAAEPTLEDYVLGVAGVICGSPVP